MELKVATRDKLGAVIIGDGFNITADGVLTIDENFVQNEEYVEFTRERLQELFEMSKKRRR